MSKKYLTIGEHGFNGDFYSCEDSPAFRADNLAIATKIAFNHWLQNFDPLYRECVLVSITDDSFTVSITDDGEFSRTETHTVVYSGPGDMFTAKYLHEHAEQWHAERYAEMELMAAAGDPRVRRSRRSGFVMFTIYFPRYQSNGEWWSSENTYLSDEKPLADQQWDFFLADEKTREQICERNFNAMRAAQKKMFEDIGYVPKNDQTGTCDNCKKPLFNSTVPVHNHGNLMATLCTDCGLNHPEIVDKFYYSKQEA